MNKGNNYNEYEKNNEEYFISKQYKTISNVFCPNYLKQFCSDYLKQLCPKYLKQLCCDGTFYED